MVVVDINLILSSTRAESDDDPPIAVPVASARAESPISISVASSTTIAVASLPSPIIAEQSSLMESSIIESESESSATNNYDTLDVIVVETINDGDDDGEVVAVVGESHEASAEIIAKYEEIIPSLFDDEVPDTDNSDSADNDGSDDDNSQDTKRSSFATEEEGGNKSIVQLRKCTHCIPQACKAIKKKSTTDLDAGYLGCGILNVSEAD